MCLVLYGSASGNAEDLAEVLYDRLRRRRLANAVCKPFGLASVAEMQAHRHVFVICATTGQGSLPPQTQPLWTQALLKRSLRAPALANVRLYSFGLGSSAYAKFNWAVRKIHARLLQLGAREGVARGEGDDLGAEPYEAVFDQWMAMALSELDSDLQITEVIPEDVLLPPINKVEFAGDVTAQMAGLRMEDSAGAQRVLAETTSPIGKEGAAGEKTEIIKNEVGDENWVESDKKLAEFGKHTELAPNPVPNGGISTEIGEKSVRNGGSVELGDAADDGEVPMKPDKTASPTDRRQVKLGQISSYTPEVSITVGENATKPGPKPALGALSYVAESSVEPVAQSENATILGNTRITDPQHFQDVRHITIQLDSPISYEPGDVVRLYPCNDEATVDAILAAQNWNPDQVVTPSAGTCTLRELLLRHVDLNAIPRRRFFALGQHFCSKPAQRERMQEFSSDLDDLFNYTSRPRRSIAEVVLEFDSLRIPVAYILDILPPLRSRQFSIASRPDAHRVELCVAIVKYRTVLRRVRRGLCTRWLDQRGEPGARLRVTLEPSRLQLSAKTAGRPVILVATGTGIAPIRSWMQNTAAQPWLFFGCRNHRDFLYAGEFGNARVVPAFSQPLDPGQPKMYVQHAIKQHAAELPVKDAVIFVCGSSGPMPKAVREAFVECLQVQGHAGAEQIVQAKEKAGLYYQETW